MAFDAHLESAAAIRPAHVQQDGLSVGVPEVDAVVAGAGIAGLAAALELQGRGREVLVVDPVGSARRRDAHRSRARASWSSAVPTPRSVKAPMLRLPRGARARGGAASRRARRAACATCSATARWCACRRRRFGLLRTPLLSARGKLRAARPSRSCGAATRGERDGRRVRGAARRRRGRAARWSGRSSTGVYAGDEAQLGAEAVLPALASSSSAATDRSRSAACCVGALAARRARTARDARSGQHGFGPLARQLAEPAERAARARQPRRRASRATATRWHVDITRAERRRSRCARAASCSRRRRYAAAEVAARRRCARSPRRSPASPTRRSCRSPSASQPGDARVRDRGLRLPGAARGVDAAARLPVHEPALPGPRARGQRAAPVHARRRALARGRRRSRTTSLLAALRRRSRAHARLSRRARWCSARALAARDSAARARPRRAPCASRASDCRRVSRWRAPTSPGVGVSDALASGLAAADVAVAAAEPSRDAARCAAASTQRRVRVQARHQQQLLAAERAPLRARADADLLERLEAVGDERRAQHRERAARPRRAQPGSSTSV